MTSTYPICKKHDSEEVRFYCSECDTLICDNCIIHDHSSHTKMKLKEYTKEHSKQLLELANSAERDVIPKLENQISLTERHKDRYIAAVDKEIYKLNEKWNSIRKLFEDYQNDLLHKFEEEKASACLKYDQFVAKKSGKMSSIRQAVANVLEKGTDITILEIEKYRQDLCELLHGDDNSDYLEDIPLITPSYLQCHEDVLTNLKVEHVLGHIESSICPTDKSDGTEVKQDNFNNKCDESESSDDDNTSDFIEDTNKGFYSDLTYDEVDRQGFVIVHSFQLKSNVVHIVPKTETFHAWCFKRQVTDITYNNNIIDIKVLKSLSHTPVSACKNSSNDLIMCFQNKTTLQQLQLTSSILRRQPTYNCVSYLDIKAQIACITSPASQEEDILVCFPEQNKNLQHSFLLRWYFCDKTISREILLQAGTGEGVENPTFISESTSGNICIVSSPYAKSSWLTLFDRNGKEIMRYPSKLAAIKRKFWCEFIGAGFLSDGTLTILDKANNQQHRVDNTGFAMQVDSYDKKPTCFAIDRFDNIWIGFHGGEIKVINYKDTYSYIS